MRGGHRKHVLFGSLQRTGVKLQRAVCAHSIGINRHAHPGRIRRRRGGRRLLHPGWTDAGRRIGHGPQNVRSAVQAVEEFQLDALRRSRPGAVGPAPDAENVFLSRHGGHFLAETSARAAGRRPRAPDGPVPRSRRRTPRHAGGRSPPRAVGIGIARFPVLRRLGVGPGLGFESGVVQQVGVDRVGGGNDGARVPARYVGPRADFRGGRHGNRLGVERRGFAGIGPVQRVADFRSGRRAGHFHQHQAGVGPRGRRKLRRRRQVVAQDQRLRGTGGDLDQRRVAELVRGMRPAGRRRRPQGGLVGGPGQFRAVQAGAVVGRAAHVGVEIFQVRIKSAFRRGEIGLDRFAGVRQRDRLPVVGAGFVAVGFSVVVVVDERRRVRGRQQQQIEVGDGRFADVVLDRLHRNDRPVAREQRQVRPSGAVHRIGEGLAAGIFRALEEIAPRAGRQVDAFLRLARRDDRRRQQGVAEHPGVLDVGRIGIVRKRHRQRAYDPHARFMQPAVVGIDVGDQAVAQPDRRGRDRLGLRAVDPRLALLVLLAVHPEDRHHRTELHPARVAFRRGLVGVVEPADVHAPPRGAHADRGQHPFALVRHGGEPAVDVAGPHRVGVALRARPEIAVDGPYPLVRMPALALVERPLHVQELPVAEQHAAAARLVGLVVPPGDHARIERIGDVVEIPRPAGRIGEIHVFDRLARKIIAVFRLPRPPEAVRRRVAALLGIHVDARLHDAADPDPLRIHLRPQRAGRPAGKLRRVPDPFAVVVRAPLLPVEVQHVQIERNAARAVAGDDVRQFALRDAPLGVGEAHAPLREHRRQPAHFRRRRQDRFRPADQQIGLHLRARTILRHQVGGRRVELDAVRIHQQPETLSVPDQRRAAIALVARFRPAARRAQQSGRRIVPDVVSGDAVKIGSRAVRQANAVGKNPFRRRFPDHRRAVRIGHRHPARRTRDFHAHRRRRHHDRVGVRIDRRPRIGPIRRPDDRRPGIAAAPGLVVQPQDVARTNLHFQLIRSADDPQPVAGNRQRRDRAQGAFRPPSPQQSQRHPQPSGQSRKAFAGGTTCGFGRLIPFHRAISTVTGWRGS